MRVAGTVKEMKAVTKRRVGWNEATCASTERKIFGKPPWQEDLYIKGGGWWTNVQYSVVP